MATGGEQGAAISISPCKVARLSFDVYDKMGYRRLAPGGTTPPADCSDMPAGTGQVADLASTSVGIASTGANSAVYLDRFNPDSDCDTSWTGSVSSDWHDALNWTSGMPDATTAACIGTARPTVEIWSDASAASLVNEGSLTLTATSSLVSLNIAGGSLTNIGTIAANGTHGTDVAANIVLNSGTVTASTSLGLMAESIENAGAMLFEASGTIAGASGGADFENTGAVVVSSGASLRVHVEGGRTFSQLAGELTLDGRLEVEGGSYGGGNLHYVGGAVTGSSAIVADDIALSIDSRADSPAGGLVVSGDLDRSPHRHPARFRPRGSRQRRHRAPRSRWWIRQCRRTGPGWQCKQFVLLRQRRAVQELGQPCARRQLRIARGVHGGQFRSRGHPRLIADQSKRIRPGGWRHQHRAESRWPPVTG